MTDLFHRIEKERKAWTPNNPLPDSEHSHWADTVSRCLALTNLEPAVADFIKDGLDSCDKVKLAPAIKSLKRNIQDEEKHEIALTRYKLAMSNYNSMFEQEAQGIINRWTSLTDNPITTAAVLENGVFFVILPIYANAGSISLRITSNSISNDEALHVRSHRAAAQLLGAKPSKALNQLRRDTISWIGASLKDDGAKWDLDRLMRNSDSLMARGISDFVETKTTSVIAPFEVKNETMDAYA